jgi:hypothetical protein
VYWYAAREPLICGLGWLGLTVLVLSVPRGKDKGGRCERAGMERDMFDSLCRVQFAAALDSVGPFSTLGNTPLLGDATPIGRPTLFPEFWNTLSRW